MNDTYESASQSLERMSRAYMWGKTIRPFWGISQLQTVLNGARRGEERDYFFGKLEEYAQRVDSMPKTYEQDGMGDDAIVYLHYFSGSSDWYVTEKDVETAQHQAFGYAILNGDTHNSELGYICIAELAQHGVELDLHWEPKTLREVKRSHGI